MKRFVIPLLAAITLSAPARADVTAPFIGFLDRSCSDGTQTLAQGIASMNGWRAADAQEQGFISGFLAEIEIRTALIRSQTSGAPLKDLQGVALTRINGWLAEGNEINPQAAILISTDNKSIALYRSHHQTGDLKITACTLMLNGPNQELLDAMIARFDVFPERSDDLIRNWQGRDTVEIDGTRISNTRGLTLRKNHDGKPNVILLDYMTILNSK